MTQHRVNQDQEWLRLYRAAKELVRATSTGEASISGPEGWVWSDLGRALERIQLTPEEQELVKP